MFKTTWREQIGQTLAENGEAWSDIVSITLTDAELDREFDTGMAAPAGDSFTAWTSDFVYFPLCYVGSEWCGSAPRNPNGKAADPQGDNGKSRRTLTDL